ncbi:MAG: hypothetical protein RI918_2043, partial [Pseudomonadota bacterium]
MPIFIIDKHPLLREHLRMLLQHQMPFVKLGHLAGKEAAAAYEALSF